MAYADNIRSATATMNDVATLIEGIFASGYPATWTSWTPSYSASGSMTYTSVTTEYGKYIQVGKLILFILRATGTTGGSASDALVFTPPVNAAAATVTGLAIGAGSVNDGGNTAALCLRYTAVSSFAVYRSNFANYGTGASRTINVMGVYEAA